MNTQPIEKQTDALGALQVHSIFPTIQGEGPFVGRPAIFIRLAGCNLQCPLCDTEYTRGRRIMGAEEIVDAVNGHHDLLKHPLVVITGGEPFRQNITDLVMRLREAKYDVQIETNGTLYLQDFPYELATIVCSPKAGKINHRLLRRPGAIDAFKYVVRWGEIDTDGLPFEALHHPASPRVTRPPIGFTGPVYVQPVDEKNDKLNALNLQAAVDSCMTHGYILGVQLHKIIGKE